MWRDICPKMVYNWPISPRKDAQHHSLPGKRKSKSQWDAGPHPLGRLRERRRVASAGENVEKREHISPAGGKGKQSDGSSKRSTQSYGTTRCFHSSASTHEPWRPVSTQTPAISVRSSTTHSSQRVETTRIRSSPDRIRGLRAGVTSSPPRSHAVAEGWQFAGSARTSNPPDPVLFLPQ